MTKHPVSIVSIDYFFGPTQYQVTVEGHTVYAGRDASEAGAIYESWQRLLRAQALIAWKQ